MSDSRFAAIIRGLIELATGSEFLVGLSIGAVVVFFLWMVATPDGETDAPRDSRLGMTGAVLAAGAVAGWVFTGSLNQTVLTGLLLVGFGVLIARLVGVTALAAAAIPGSVLISVARAVGPQLWIELVAVISIPAFGWLIQQVDDAFSGRRLAVPLVAVSQAGIVATVAEPDRAVLLFGVLLPAAIASWFLGRGRIGALGSYCLAAVIVVSILVSNEGRSAGIIGGLFAVAVLAVLLYGGRPRRAETAPHRAWALPWILGAHLGGVYWMARVAGLQRRPGAALITAVAGLVAIWAVSAALPLDRLKMKAGNGGFRS